MAITILYFENFADASAGTNKQINELGLMTDIASIEDYITECALYNHAVEKPHSGPPSDLLCSGVYQSSVAPTKCNLNNGVLSDAVSVGWGAGKQIDSAVLDWGPS